MKKKFLADGIGFVELMEVFGSDLTIVNAARVSFNKESTFEEVAGSEDSSTSELRLAERDRKLINFLALHNHTTPFFHPIIRFRIKMPIYVAREWWRSCVGFARNEVSRRYVSFEPECFIPEEFRKRDVNVKQGSKNEPVDRNEQVRERVAEFFAQTLALYNDLMAIEGVCPEQARGVLPQAMYTEFIETASLAGYARLVQLRTDPAAQREIQLYACMVSELIEPHFPAGCQALKGAMLEQQPLSALVSEQPRTSEVR